MLWETFLEPCTKQIRNRVPDNQGGFNSTLTDGIEFNAAIVKDTTLEETVAEKDISVANYLITTKEDIVLNYHDIVKRKRDNKKFRVTSDYLDTKPPSVATFKFNQVSAEEWKP
jgi:hypothetical protein